MNFAGCTSVVRRQLEAEWWFIAGKTGWAATVWV